MKPFLFSILVFNFICLSCNCQSHVESYYKEKNDVLKSKLALGLWEYYSRYHIDSLNIIGLDLLTKSTQSNDPFVKAVSFRLLGCYDVRSGSIENGLRLLNSSKSIFLNLGDEKLVSEAYNEIGIAHLQLGDYQTARSFFGHSLTHGNKSGISEMKYMAEINLAKSDLQAGRLRSAKMIAEHYIRLALEEGKFESVANAYSFLGQIALDEDQLKRAKFCFNKQLEYSKLTNAPLIKTRALNNQAILSFISSNFDKSLSLFREVLKERKKQMFHAYTCESYMNIGNFFHERLDSIRGNQYLDSCIFLAQKHKLLSNEIEALEIKIEFQRNPEHAKQLNELYKKQQDMIISNLSIRENFMKNNKKEDNQYLYLLLILILLPFAVWLIYRKP